jgi:glycosyltransferase involved in cell wall biosynthesis
MRILMNFREALWLSGGANSFLATLRRRLKRHGVTFTRRLSDDFDLALLNALTDGLDLDQVRRIHARGKPIIHRKVGYRVSGSALMRSVKDGVVHGERLQIEFSPFVQHTVFQSEYSRDTFLSEGFSGDYSVIRNGVDNGTFNRTFRSSLFGAGDETLPFWDGKSTFRLAIVTWSMDPNKGFEDYEAFDAALGGLKNVEIWFVGRIPEGVRFRNFRVFSPRGHRCLAGILKQCHGFIQMAQHETCSNALIEAMSCGLPVIYRDSGSARELAEPCGVIYQDRPLDAIWELMSRYEVLAPKACREELFIDRVATRYLNLIEDVCRAT